MIIDLKSIEEKGKDYCFDELSDELQGAFDDLIGAYPYKISLSIKLLGNTYQILGQVQSSYQDVCSQCGYEIEVPLKHKINEIVVIEKVRPRNTQVSQSRQNFDAQGPAVTYINDPSFDLSEFLHEMMASGFDQYPRCHNRDLCESRQYSEKKEIMTEPEVLGHPGFASLKNIKIKKT